ncbi:MAG: polysaccharide biosynthesis tyrosine autokinase [Pseudomonadota bacterium]
MNSRVIPVDLCRFERPAALRRAPSASDRGDADTVDLRGLFRAVWRGRWGILAWMFGLGALLYIAVRTVEPTFEATAKVMLDPRTAQIMAGQELVRDLDLSEEVVNGEAAVLRSNVLVERVISEIGPLRVDHENTFELTPEIEADILEAIALPDARSAEMDQLIQGLVWLIRRDLTVFRDGESYVISIRTAHHDPALAAEIANTIATSYIGAQVDDRRDTTTSATAWLEDRAEELRAQLDVAEAGVAAARAAGLNLDGGSAETVRQQIAELNGQLVAARSDRVAAEALIDRLEAVRARGGIAEVAEIASSPLIEQLNLERIDLERQDAQWAQRYDVDHPERQRIARAQAGLDGELAGEVERIIAQRRNETQIALLRETSLRDGIAELEERVVSISSNEGGLRQLEREAQAKRDTYETLLARLAQARTQEQLTQPDAKLIERASVPSAPSAPRPKLMAALGLMLGLAGGLSRILFRELTADTFRRASDLEAETGLPVLAVTPVQPWQGLMASTAALRDTPYTPYGERMRHLRTSILMREGREQSRAVMMLSAAPGEGKTTTTLALAQMSVLAGKSVVVVDADLRRSTVQAAFGWDMEHDFADFIRGDCSLDKAIYTDPDFGFDVLAARGTHPDVADKLAVGWLSAVVSELKRVYDVVLIDAPAMLAVSDALVVAQVVDTRVFMVKWDATPRRSVLDGLAALEDVGLGVHGLVFTMVDPERSPDAQATGYSYDV